MIRELDIYGRVRQEEGETNFVPFLFQGQYYDVETKLAYNRFRYYAPEWGMYISQDPIRLEAGLTNLYAYVHDTNGWIDPLGLTGTYAFITDDGKAYVGKGPWRRFRQSVRRKFRKEFKGDSLKSWVSQDWGDNDIGEMVEARLIHIIKKNQSFELYNKIASPGAKKFDAQEANIQNMIDKYAQDMYDELTTTKKKTIKKPRNNH